MDASLIEKLVSRSQPLSIETAPGRVFEAPRRDSMSFSPRRKSISIFFEEDGEESFAIVPLLTVTGAMTKFREGVTASPWVKVEAGTVLPQVKMTPGSKKEGDTLPHN